jgi:polysaccharide export outer membrane protein
MARKIIRRAGMLSIIGVLALWTAAEFAAASQDEGVAGSASSGKVDYRVGPGDVIEVLVWKEPEASSTVVIRPDGKISLPLINDLEVTGKAPMEIQAIVTERLDPYIKAPNVTVTVKEINSKKVFVLGEIARPGAYEITQPTTVLQVLTEAGGLQPFAKQNSIYILRTENDKQAKFPFRYKDVLKGERIDQNILLKPGDTIVVP